MVALGVVAGFEGLQRERQREFGTVVGEDGIGGLSGGGTTRLLKVLGFEEAVAAAHADVL